MGPQVEVTVPNGRGEMPFRSPPRSARSRSISSDAVSRSSRAGLFSPPSTISPDPTFIAASAASQIVTNDHDSRADYWLDQNGVSPSGEPAFVAPAALMLANRFLDQLLYNFLRISRSTALGSLRQAVIEVLKTKMAKDAIAGADEELQEYLGGGEDEELQAFHNGQEPSGDWDLELVWKRTRLRCMVYSSLGDMEEEEEDYYTEKEELDGPPGANTRFTNNSGVVSPAVAIFLTSVLEYMGEQALIAAGQAAYERRRKAHGQEPRRPGVAASDVLDSRIVVEERDMDQIGMDRTMGRLWRAWKKRVRTPNSSVSMVRSFSRDNVYSPSRGPYGASSSQTGYSEEEVPTSSMAEVLSEHEFAAIVPLPESADDVREIEIPGLVAHSDDEEDVPYASEKSGLPTRPKSFMIFSAPVEAPISPTASEAYHSDSMNRPRKRSYSLPTPVQSPYSATPPRDFEADIDEHVEERGRPLNPIEAQESWGGVLPEDMEKFEAPPRSANRNGFVGGAITGAAVANSQAPQTELEDIYRRAETQQDHVSEIRRAPSSQVPFENSAASASMSRDAPSGFRSHRMAANQGHQGQGNPQTRLSRADSEDYSPIMIDIQPPHIGNDPAVGPRSDSALGRTAFHEQGDGNVSPVSPVHEYDDFSLAPDGPTPEEEASKYQSFINPPGPAPQNHTFVLGAAPNPRSGRENRKYQVSPSTTPPAQESKRFMPENGAPPLTPLREMTEGASDPPNDHMKMHHGYDSRGVSATSSYAESPTAPDVTPTYQTYTNKLAEQQMPVRPYNNTGYRSSPTSAPREDPIRSYGFDQNSKPVTRPIQTSGSASSSIASQKIRISRSSDDSGPRVRDESKSQSFEQLIRSEQTIQYTLTPQSVQDHEVPDSPRWTTSAVRIDSHDSHRPPTSRSHSGSVGKLTTGLNSNPPPPQAIGKLAKVDRSPSSPLGSKQRKPQSRDARAHSESVTDFADFLKSTGPTGASREVNMAPAIAPSPVDRRANGMTINTRVINGVIQGPGAIPGTVPAGPSSPALTGRSSTSSKMKLQARDATVGRDSIGDLISIIREGPLDGERANPRSLQPVHATDADRTSSPRSPKGVYIPERQSQVSTNTSSINSQSALISNASIPRATPAQSRKPIDDDDDMIPKRKQRRVRDMYAIDSSDEEDGQDEFDAPPRKPAAPKEESLADFLKNMPPPPSPPRPQPLMLSTATVQAATAKTKKKNGFFSRSSSSQSQSVPQSPGGSSRPKTSTSSKYTPISSSQYSASLARTSTVNSEISAGDSGYKASAEAARRPTGTRVLQKQYQPREAVQTHTRTDDLADFFRSEPPVSTAQPRPFSPAPDMHQKEDSGGFTSRVFGRRKKVAGY